MAKIQDYGERAATCLKEIENNRFNPEVAITYAREVLAIVEKQDNGKSDFYCKLVSSIANHDLYKLICENYLQEFLIDYNPTSDATAYALYGSLSDSCYYMLGKHPDKEDEMHTLFFNAFLKYGTLDIEYREKNGKDKFRGMYNLAVVYHDEYTLTQEPKYKEEAEKLYEATLYSRWGEFSKKNLESLCK